MADLPSISILVPTLNAALVLERCLKSIKNQDYPQKNLEIIIADGGSTDKTLEIAKKYGAKIYKNPLKTGEAGKAVALKHAQGDLVALIDSDNVLPDKNWLKRMVEPFFDLEIIGSEPWEFTWRSQDGFIDRYCALFGMNDPLCYFLGNYDRLNILTGKWTGLPVEQEDKGRWMVTTLKPDALPTIGANGTVLRRVIFGQHHLGGGGIAASGGKEHLGGVNIGDYFVDIDVIAELAAEEPVKFAKVKTGIIHLYCGSSIATFIYKQRRRVKDYLYYQMSGQRFYPWQKQGKGGILKFILACVTITPLFYQTLKGYFRKPDYAWFFHPLACWLTLWVYGSELILAKFKVEKMSREKWGQ